VTGPESYTPACSKETIETCHRLQTQWQVFGKIIMRSPYMEEKKSTQSDSKKKFPLPSKSNPLKPQSVKPKPPAPKTEDDFSFDNEDETYYRDDHRGD